MRTSMLGKKNPSWKGDSVSNRSLHSWIRKNKKYNGFCNKCKKKLDFSNVDAANISQEYKRDVNDFEWLCRSCHFNGDGRFKKMYNANKRNKPRRTIIDGKTKCSRCGKLKSFDCFIKNKKIKNGLKISSECKECKNKSMRLYRKNNFIIEQKKEVKANEN